MYNYTKDVSVNVFRKLHCIFFPSDFLDRYVAKPPDTLEEILLAEAQLEVKRQLLFIIAKSSKKILTHYQHTVVNHILNNKTQLDASRAMHTNPINSYYSIWVALFGKKCVSKTRTYRAGGAYKKLRVKLARSHKVRKLLRTWDSINHADIEVAKQFLKTADMSFWDKYIKENE